MNREQLEAIRARDAAIRGPLCDQPERDRRALLAAYDTLAAAARKVMADAPTLECQNFHHAKADLHKGFNCSVSDRWANACADLRKLLEGER